jgi:hypothetical protein
MDIKSLATEAYKWFTVKTRDNGEQHVCLKDDHPEWVKSAVYEAHDSMLPDDYKFEYAMMAFEHLAESGEADDFEPSVDVYNARLLKWVSSHLERSAYVDQAMEEYGSKTHFDALMAGQDIEQREVCYKIYSFLDDMVENHEDEDEAEVAV